MFREVQHFRQILLWLLLLAIFALMLYAAVQQLILGEPFGSNPAPDIALVFIVLIFGIGFPLFFYVINLATEVRADGLYYRFFPFHFSYRKIAFEEMKMYEARKYSPIREYGGWGIRYGMKGRAYNVGGNRGIQLELANGKRILFGSRRPEEFVEAIDRALKQKRAL